jgi:uncharacterized OB-fold protein
MSAVESSEGITMQQSYLDGAFPMPSAEEGTVDADFLSLTREHRLVIQQCQDCGRGQFPPELICRRCQSTRVKWTDIEPRGVVFSWTRVWHPASPGARDKVPYLVAVVDVGRPGVRFVGNILGDPLQEVTIGDPVTAVFEDHPEDNIALIQWTRQPPPA